ncbi:MAG: hypothetical protein ACKO6Q_09870 [Bacteroidota bacterium]
MSPEEQNFVNYWAANRERKKSWIRQLYIGLPLSLVLVLGIFANLLSGWYGRAQMAMFRQSSSLILVLLIAAVGVVAFLVIFSARHRWDMQEQRYQELQAKYSSQKKSS